MEGAGDAWVQCFTCCLTQQGPGARNKRQRPQQRHRIDRSMIGAPTNFQHTGHIESHDLDHSVDLSAIKIQMQRKGGYGASFGVKAYC